MRFKDFLNSLDDPLKFYLQYSLKRLGLTLDNVERRRRCRWWPRPPAPTSPRSSTRCT